MRRRWVMTYLGLCVLAAMTLGVGAWTRDRSDRPPSLPAASTTTTTSTTTPPPASPLRVVILGDSYTQLDEWASQVADVANWDHVNLALSGTGYVSTAGRSACGLDVCPAYGEQLDAAARLAPTADVVIVTGGVNDPTGPDVDEAVRATYTKARASFPQAAIVGFSPFGRATDYSDSLVSLRDIIESEVTRVGGVYVDVGHPLADRPDLIRADGLHPTDEGQRVLAESILEALQTQAPELIG